MYKRFFFVKLRKITQFYYRFEIGELRVRKKLFALNQMLHSKAPFILTIIAEEMGTHPSEPNTTSTIDVALIIEDQSNDAPEFNQER